MSGRIPCACLTSSSFALGLAACGPQYPVEYETEHLLVAKTFSAPICAGTLRAMELDAARIAEQLGGQKYAPVDVVLGVEAVTEHCPPDSTGCAHRGDPVYTQFNSLGHELVHAFAGGRISLPFVEEGLAEALGGGMLNVHAFEVDTASISIADEVVELTTGDDAAYNIAGHFVVWLIDRWGLDAFLSFRAALPPDASLAKIASSFEAIYGVSLESAELDWQTTTPSRYRLGQGSCGGPSEVWIDERHWAGRLEVDCDAETTFGPLGDSSAVEAGMWTSVLVDVLREGEYQLSVTATRAGAIEVDAYACGCNLGLETSANYGVQPGSHVFDVHLFQCRYRVSYAVEGVEYAAADVALELVEM